MDETDQVICILNFHFYTMCVLLYFLRYVVLFAFHFSTFEGDMAAEKCIFALRKTGASLMINGVDVASVSETQGDRDCGQKGTRFLGKETPPRTSRLMVPTWR